MSSAFTSNYLSTSEKPDLTWLLRDKKLSDKDIETLKLAVQSGLASGSINFFSAVEAYDALNRLEK